MINIRSVSTLGIGFGIAAIAVIGLVSEAPPTTEQPYSLLGGGARLVPPVTKVVKKETHKRTVSKKLSQATVFQSERIKIDIPLHISEDHEEETILGFLLSELFRRDLI